MCDHAALLRQLQAMPAGALVPAEWLAEQLEADVQQRPETVKETAHPRGAGLTAAKVAEELGRTASCVRSWCRSGRIPGAYRLVGREWRIPESALQAFLEREAERAETPLPPKIQTTRMPADLGAWRQEHFSNATAG